MPTRSIVALDHFAGTGWGVALRRLGIHEYGVENMKEAVATRDANGMETIYLDVWDGLLDPTLVPNHDLYIASPPCQTFSTAGKGAGVKALADVLALITGGAYTNATYVRHYTDGLDPRTALVVAPLAHIYDHLPLYVILEQVPPVLPVWEAYATEMRAMGYSVVTGVINAEQFGVPQTRRRAILIGRRDGIEATMPTPTHSRYYNRTPEKLDEGVEKWVSMAEALSWPVQPGEVQVRTSMGTPKVDGVNGSHTLDPALRPAHTLTSKSDSWAWGYTDRPAPTVTGGGGKASGIELFDQGARREILSAIETGAFIPNGREVNPDTPLDPMRLTVEEAATLQTYPTALRPEVDAWRWKDAPATTVAGDPRITAREHHYHGEQSKTSLRLTLDEAKVLQTYPTGAVKQMGKGMVERYGERPGRSIDEPAFTLRASAGGMEPGGFVFTTDDGTRKMTTPEAGTLQTYPRPFEFRGSKSKQFLQIGNAVPPLLAEAIVRHVLSI